MDLHSALTLRKTMMRFERVSWVLCMLVAATVTGAAPAQNVVVANAWARASVPGQRTAGVYLELKSDVNAAVVAVSSAAAERAELHSMTVENGVMRMRPLARIELPAGQTVKLAPGGLHVMLIDLKSPLKPGGKVRLELSVQSAGSSRPLPVEAEVRDASTTSSSPRASH